jgi:hypothetical protein
MRTIKKILSQVFYNNDFLKLYYKKQFGTMYRQIINGINSTDINILKNKLIYKGFKINYKDTDIKFNKIIDEDRLMIYLSTIDNKDNCIMIIIDKDTKSAYIEGITNNKYNKCFDNPELNNGKTIMEVTIKMLKQYKDKLNINTINLKDNMRQACYERDNQNEKSF